MQPWDLVVVCDVMPHQALRAADLAESLMGRRPSVVASIADLTAASSRLDAVIVATSPELHAEVGIAAVESGLHVLVEKPIALTVEQGVSLINAAHRARRVLAVAENYRRDPMNRLARALIDANVVGPIHLFVQQSSGSGESVIITPWRHRKRSGGIVVDMGIHYADLLEYFMGPVSQVFGFSSIVDRQRIDREGVWHDADAEDLSVGVVQFNQGAIGNWVINLAGRGAAQFARVAYGSRGTLSIPRDRSGSPLELNLRESGRDMPVDPRAHLELVPDFELDDVTAALFGGQRLAAYEMEYADIDASLLAIEQADFAAAIRDHRPPEVDGPAGLRSLAISYGFLEAEQLGRAMSVDELLTSFDLPYQRELVTQTR
jgi:predicted dehydrogenase